VRFRYDVRSRCRACAHTLHREVVLEGVIRPPDFVWYTSKRRGRYYHVRHLPTGMQWELPVGYDPAREGEGRGKMGWSRWLLSEWANRDLTALGWVPDRAWWKHMARVAWGLTWWVVPLLYLALAVGIGALFGLRHLAEMLGVPRGASQLVRVVNLLLAAAVGYGTFLLGRRRLRRAGCDIVWSSRR
jgi:hypothetical protein